MIDGDLRPRNAEINPDPDTALAGMLPGTVHGHSTILDAVEEVPQLLGSLVDVLGQAR